MAVFAPQTATLQKKNESQPRSVGSAERFDGVDFA